MATLVGMPMPQPGETITEGVVVKWLKKVGDVATEKEPVVELETAKAVFEYETPVGGKFVKIVTNEGEAQQVGQPLAILECDDKQAKRYFMLGVGVPVDAAGKAIGSSEAKIGAGAGFGGEHLPPAAGSSPTPLPQAAAAVAGAGHTPLIRTLAREHGLNDAELNAISATGPGGRLTKEDLLGYVRGRGGASKPAATVGAPTAPVRSAGSARIPPVTAGGRRVEPTTLRRRIAENMILAKSTIPHAGSAVEVDMTDLLALREGQKGAFQKKYGVPLRLAPFFLLAVREGVKRYPVCNNFYFIDEAGKHWIEEHSAINLGVAVGTPKGLVVPVLKNAETKNFAQLAKESDALMQKALNGKLGPEEMTGGTVTVNNPGALGSVRGNQVIAYPQSVIVGFHAIVERACFMQGTCVPRHLMEIDISFDHRLVDGVEAVGLLRACKEVLEQPARYFTL
ncbi:MAG: 2-oxo acid dehydrogenase subunit E2 [Deltaproteobacteria bacterium]|nr:2-oxo acid dehydrogenase subunit E2 [Deltaproteobacteria bacterium]